jgi:hypothetical protein
MKSIVSTDLSEPYQKTVISKNQILSESPAANLNREDIFRVHIIFSFYQIHFSFSKNQKLKSTFIK